MSYLNKFRYLTLSALIFNFIGFEIDAQDRKHRWQIPISDIAREQLKTMSKSELDQDWKLDNFFGTTVVINLDYATERLAEVTDELSGIGTESFTIFKGIDGRKELNPSIWQKFYGNYLDIDVSTDEGKYALDRVHQGEAGAYMSHFKLIEGIKVSFDEALEKYEGLRRSQDQLAIKLAADEVRRYSKVLIFEDDAGFGRLDVNEKTISKDGVGVLFRKALSQLPDDWDILYFVVHASEPTTKVSSHLRKLGRTWSLAAYAINHTIYGRLVHLLKKIEDPKVERVEPVDNVISKIHHLYNVYAIYPSIVFVREAKSQINDRTWDPWQDQPIYRK